MEDARSPVELSPLKGVPLADVQMGQDHGVALSEEGRVYCWGRGDCGRLGTTTSENMLAPKVVFQSIHA